MMINKLPLSSFFKRDQSLQNDKKSEEIFLTSLCYENVLNEINLHCVNTHSHVHYHIPLPTKFRKLLVDIVRSAIICGIIQKEHHIEIMCDVILKEQTFSFGKIDAILFILNDLFRKIQAFINKLGESKEVHAND